MDDQPTGIVWKWGYSRWMGVMYGPVPVGIIVVGIILIIYRTR
jgi:hypothetical protein